MAKGQEKKKTKISGIEVAYMHFPFLCFLVFLGVLYISNIHLAEKKLRQIQTAEKQIDESKWKYMDMQQEIMWESTQSKLLYELKESGLKENRSIPEKISVEKS